MLTAARNSSIEFALADRSDDAAIRALLRETPMRGGDVAVGFTREPDYFDSLDHDAGVGGEHRVIVARASNGQLACFGAIVIRRRYFNGQPRRIGYLGHLRLAESFAGRFDIVRRGYDMFRELSRSLDVHAYFTSIAADNARAVRFLTRGIHGLPTYRPLGELVTCLIRVPRRGDELFDGPTEKPAAIPQLRPADAGAAIADLRSIKQSFVAGYSQRLRMIRPLYNAWAALSGRGVALPAVGVPIAHAFVTNPSPPLLLAEARRLNLSSISIALDARDPRLPILASRFSMRRYRTRLFTVHWPGDPTTELPDQRLIDPDISSL